MDLIKAINDAISQRNREENRLYIGASNIGNPCLRAVWYAYKGYESEKFPTNTQITFDIGKNLERLLLDYLEASGMNIERANEANNYLFCQHEKIKDFQGHIDALIHTDNAEPIILEIKTAKASSFAVFKKDGLKVWSKIYYSQIQSYMGMTGYKSAIILVLNKDSSELCMEWVYFDEDYYLMISDKAQFIKNNTSPPERINNNSCYHLCARCVYKNVCHYQSEVVEKPIYVEI